MNVSNVSLKVTSEITPSGVVQSCAIVGVESPIDAIVRRVIDKRDRLMVRPFLSWAARRLLEWFAGKRLLPTFAGLLRNERRSA
jgi:hypothetical protein